MSSDEVIPMPDAPKPEKRPQAARRMTVKGAEETEGNLAQQYQRKKQLIPEMIWWNNISFFLAMLGMAVAIFEGQVTHLKYNEAANTPGTVMKSFVSVSTLLLFFCLYKYWTVKIEIFKVKQLVYQDASLMTHSTFKKMFFWDLLFCGLHLPPFVGDAIGRVTYGVSGFHGNNFHLLVFLRCYLFVRMLKQYFKKRFISQKVRLIGAMNKVSFDGLFVIRTYIRLQPFTILFASLIIYILVSAYTYTIFEGDEECSSAFQQDLIAKGLSDTDNCHGSDIYYYRWVIFTFALILGIEPSTVPKSVPGQIVTVLGALVGVTLLSVLIAVISQFLTLSTTESRVVDRIHEDVATRNTRETAIRFIQTYWRYMVRMKKKLRNNAELSKKISMLEGAEKERALKKVGSRADSLQRQTMMHALHRWRIMKRTGRKENMISKLSTDMSEVLDKVCLMGDWQLEVETRLQGMEKRVKFVTERMESRMEDIVTLLNGERQPVRPYSAAVAKRGHSRASVAEVDLLMQELDDIEDSK